MRQSTVPKLDLSSFSLEKEKKSSQSDDGRGPITPRSPKSSPASPYHHATTIRQVTQETSSKSDNDSVFTGSPPTATFNPSLTAIPQYPPSPKDSPKHNRDPSKSFFANLKAPKSSHKTQKSDGSGHLTEKPKSRGSSRDRRTQIPSKPYGSSPDLLAAVQRAEQQEQSE